MRDCFRIPTARTGFWRGSVLVVLLLIPVGGVTGQTGSPSNTPESRRGLQSMQPAGPSEQMQRLMQDLQSADESVRLRAAKELGKLGPAAAEAWPMLRQLTQDRDEDVRRTASAALTRFAATAQPAAGPRPDLFMLSVGIDQYPPPANLKGCVNDAEGMAGVFQKQAGKMYNQVQIQRLLEADASRAAIQTGLAALRNKGKAGDWYVIFLSGHGSTRLNRWGFLSQDNASITDAALLGLADELAGEGKKVVLIIDACQVGQLRYNADAILNKYTDRNKGGIVLMLSSMPSQLSRALGRYSAFARAVEEGLSGLADYNHDQTITMQELRRYTYNRVYQLILDSRPWPGLAVSEQDSAIDASMSMPETTPIAMGDKIVLPTEPENGPATPRPELAGIWTTAGYRLSFDGKGVFHAVWTLGEGRPPQSGAGTYYATAQAVVLQHKQGADRLELVSLTSDEFRFRFHGEEKVLRREAVSPAVNVAASTWTGTETLTGFGKLSFQFNSDGKAIMTDAKSTIEGDWSQTGNEVTVSFGNCVYVGRVQGNVLSGSARFTSREAREWTFSLTRGAAPAAPVAPIGQPPVNGAGVVANLIKSLGSPDELQRLKAAKDLAKLGPAAKAAIPALQKLLLDPDEDVRRVAASAIERIQQGPAPAPDGSVAGSTWDGTESLWGTTKLRFQLDAAGKAVMIDAGSTVNGNWTQKNGQVIITFANCVYTGTIQGQVLTGTARFTTGEPREWTFSVARAITATTYSGSRTSDGGPGRQ